MVKMIAMVFLFTFVSCQNKPTKVIEETVNVFAKDSVLVDVRSAFLYASFHIEGSVNINTSDYLILKDPRKKRYVLDPDVGQTIERLAKRGITPEKKIYLIADNADSEEQKKWAWLFRNLEIEDVILVRMEDFRRDHKSARFAIPNSERPWILKTSEEFQKEFILKKSKDCFVKWSDKLCKL